MKKERTQYYNHQFCLLLKKIQDLHDEYVTECGYGGTWKTSVHANDHRWKISIKKTFWRKKWFYKLFRKFLKGNDDAR